MRPNGPPAPRAAALAFIFVTVVLDVVAMGIIIPVLPKLIESFLHGDTAHAASLFGVFATTGALMAFVCSPFIGVLSDLFGRRKVILLSNFALGLDYIVMALAPTVGWLFLGRVISGITGATWSTAGAYIADVTTHEKRASGFGLLGAVDPRLPFWAAAGMTLVNALYGLLVLPESLPPEKRKAFAWRRANPVGSLVLLRSHRELFGLSAVHFIYFTAHNVMPSVFVLYAGYRYGWNARAVGLTLALVGVCTMIVQGALVKPVVAKLGERRALLTGLAFGTVGLLIWGLAPRGVLGLVAVPFGSLMGFYGPAAQGLMSHRVSPSEQGQLQGALASIKGVTGMIAPPLFTQMFARFIGPQRAWHLPGAPFLLASLLTVSALVLAWRVTRVRAEAGVPQPAS